MKAKFDICLDRESLTHATIPQPNLSLSSPPRLWMPTWTSRYPQSTTYGHTHWKIRDPVRSPIDKPMRAGLVVGSVTTSEYLVFGDLFGLHMGHDLHLSTDLELFIAKLHLITGEFHSLFLRKPSEALTIGAIDLRMGVFPPRPAMTCETPFPFWQPSWKPFPQELAAVAAVFRVPFSSASSLTSSNTTNHNNYHCRRKTRRITQNRFGSNFQHAMWLSTNHSSQPLGPSSGTIRYFVLAKPKKMRSLFCFFTNSSSRVQKRQVTGLGRVQEKANIGQADTNARLPLPNGPRPVRFPWYDCVAPDGWQRFFIGDNVGMVTEPRPVCYRNHTSLHPEIRQLVFQWYKQLAMRRLARSPPKMSPCGRQSATMVLNRSKSTSDRHFAYFILGSQSTDPQLMVLLFLTTKYLVRYQFSILTHQGNESHLRWVVAESNMFTLQPKGGSFFCKILQDDLFPLHLQCIMGVSPSSSCFFLQGIGQGKTRDIAIEASTHITGAAGPGPRNLLPVHKSGPEPSRNARKAKSQNDMVDPVVSLETWSLLMAIARCSMQIHLQTRHSYDRLAKLGVSCQGGSTSKDRFKIFINLLLKRSPPPATIFGIHMAFIDPSSGFGTLMLVTGLPSDDDRHAPARQHGGRSVLAGSAGRISRVPTVEQFCPVLDITLLLGSILRWARAIGNLHSKSPLLQLGTKLSHGASHTRVVALGSVSLAREIIGLNSMTDPSNNFCNDQQASHAVFPGPICLQNRPLRSSPSVTAQASQFAGLSLNVEVFDLRLTRPKRLATSFRGLPKTSLSSFPVLPTYSELSSRKSRLSSKFDEVLHLDQFTLPVIFAAAAMCLIDVHHKLRSGHGIPDAVNRIQAIASRCSIHVRVEPEYAGLCRKMSKISAECLHPSLARILARMIASMRRPQGAVVGVVFQQCLPEPLTMSKVGLLRYGTSLVQPLVMATMARLGRWLRCSSTATPVSIDLRKAPIVQVVEAPHGDEMLWGIAVDIRPCRQGISQQPMPLEDLLLARRSSTAQRGFIVTYPRDDLHTLMRHRIKAQIRAAGTGYCREGIACLQPVNSKVPRPLPAGGNLGPPSPHWGRGSLESGTFGFGPLCDSSVFLRANSPSLWPSTDHQQTSSFGERIAISGGLRRSETIMAEVALIPPAAAQSCIMADCLTRHFDQPKQHTLPLELPDTWDLVGCALLHLQSNVRTVGGQGKPPTLLASLLPHSPPPTYGYRQQVLRKDTPISLASSHESTAELSQALRSPESVKDNLLTTPGGRGCGAGLEASLRPCSDEYPYANLEAMSQDPRLISCYFGSGGSPLVNLGCLLKLLVCSTWQVDKGVSTKHTFNNLAHARGSKQTATQVNSEYRDGLSPEAPRRRSNARKELVVTKTDIFAPVSGSGEEDAGSVRLWKLRWTADLKATPGRAVLLREEAKEAVSFAFRMNIQYYPARVRKISWLDSDLQQNVRQIHNVHHLDLSPRETTLALENRMKDFELRHAVPTDEGLPANRCAVGVFYLRPAAENANGLTCGGSSSLFDGQQQQAMGRIQGTAVASEPSGFVEKRKRGNDKTNLRPNTPGWLDRCTPPHGLRAFLALSRATCASRET
ncbi:uncharacterized protein CLUP02_01388 [Colletotrichum lupini]|uniref:Uncharacterized protein n=1 Tax=Colletotrichum lupini TaxID=145971 RepID=A0A9Q8W986_9PEZI|nr:uncharacterized protein CLUP02_01388 [Colletotrichum lupini]UQC74736.1 hypothetical protein CLUP02_01388 [Colletotrichum lupini]